MAHRLPLRILLVSLLAFAFAVGHGAAQAADTAAISVSPGSATASVGDDVTLDINVANVPTAPGLGGYVIVVQWDPAVLQLTSLADAGWVTGGNIIVVCDAAAINNTAGNAELDCTPTLAFGTGVTTTAPHVVAQAVFHAKAPGTTAVNLTGSSVMNPSNIALTSTISGGSVTVAAAAPTPNATATVQPKATPATVVPTSTPAAQATSTSAAIPATPSTKPTETTLSKVEVPQTGSGTAASGGTAWRMPVLAVALAVLLAAGGAVAFRRAGKNNNGG